MHEGEKLISYKDIKPLDSYQFDFTQKAQNIFQFLCKPLVCGRL